MDVNSLIEISWPIGALFLFALGAGLGAMVNWATYGLAYHSRSISPWSRRGAPPRPWRMRIPILGWWFMRRERDLHGGGFWIRPAAVELAGAIGCLALYRYEVVQAGLMPTPQETLIPLALADAPDLLVVLHWQFLAHLLLFSAMAVASLIDMDEKTIPDAVTVPTTLLGLLFSIACPWSLPPSERWVFPGGKVAVEFLNLASPLSWPDVLAPYPNPRSLALALGCWGAWCAALLPWRWRSRRGWGQAWRLLAARLTRDAGSKALWGIGLIGGIVIVALWRGPDLPRWTALCSSLFGIAVGGGLIWVVRIVASRVLHREAMGFGDVTLMGMIGAFLGWQCALFTFFLSPLPALAAAIVQWLRRRESEIYFGPFLCLGAAATILAWRGLWDWAWPIFEVGWLVPAMLGVCLVLMAVLLYPMRLLREWLERDS